MLQMETKVSLVSDEEPIAQSWGSKAAKLRMTGNCNYPLHGSRLGRSGWVGPLSSLLRVPGLRKGMNPSTERQLFFGKDKAPE